MKQRIVWLAACGLGLAALSLTIGPSSAQRPGPGGAGGGFGLFGATGRFTVAHASADVTALAVAIVRGGFEYQGQKCSAVSRVYVPRSMWNDLRERMVAMIRDVKMDTDGQLVGKVSNGGFGPSAESNSRELQPRQLVAHGAKEVLAFVFSRPEPSQRTVIEHRIKQHHPLNHPSVRRTLSEAAVGLANRRPEWLVVQVKHAPAMELSRRDRRGQPRGHAGDPEGHPVGQLRAPLDR